MFSLTYLRHDLRIRKSWGQAPHF